MQYEEYQETMTDPQQAKTYIDSSEKSLNHQLVEA